MGQIYALMALRLLLAAGTTLALAPTALIRGGGGGDNEGEPGESKEGAGTMTAAVAILASPVAYAVFLALLLYCRPRGALGSGVLLAIGATEGAAIGGVLVIVGWAWIVKTVGAAAQ